MGKNGKFFISRRGIVKKSKFYFIFFGLSFFLLMLTNPELGVLGFALAAAVKKRSDVVDSSAAEVSFLDSNLAFQRNDDNFNMEKISEIKLQETVSSSVLKVVPYGSEFRVNTYTANDQCNPAVAGLTDGKFVVVWESYLQSEAGWGVYRQMYHATGTKYGFESQMRPSTVGTYFYRRPSIVGLSNGKFVVAWQTYSQDRYRISGQLYNPDGTSCGNSFRISYSPLHQEGPVVANLSDGKFVITWGCHEASGSCCGIFGQLFNYHLNGTTDGAEFVVLSVGTSTTVYVSGISVSGLSDGKFVVVWSSYDIVYGQLYNSDGTIYGHNFRVSTYYAKSSTVAGLSDGKFVVAWGWGMYDVYGQLYNSNGTTYGHEFRINTYLPKRQMFPSIVSLFDGKFVVTWESERQDGDDWGIYGQMYDATGTKQGLEFQINTYTTRNQRGLSVASLIDKKFVEKFVVVWESEYQDGYGYGIYGQIFSSTKINHCPILTTNFLIIYEKKAVILTSENLAATDEDSPNSDLIFTISDIQYGQFEVINNSGVAITTFTQLQIIDRQIKFVPKGKVAPSYKVSVKDQFSLSTEPTSANIIYKTKSKNFFRGIIIGACLIGVVLLTGIIIFACEKRRKKEKHFMQPQEGLTNNTISGLQPLQLIETIPEKTSENDLPPLYSLAKSINNIYFLTDKNVSFPSIVELKQQNVISDSEVEVIEEGDYEKDSMKQIGSQMGFFKKPQSKQQKSNIVHITKLGLSSL
jgi:hypothetical protein